MGGKPSKGTKADMRLKQNKPNAGNVPLREPKTKQPPARPSGELKSVIFKNGKQVTYGD